MKLPKGTGKSGRIPRAPRRNQYSKTNYKQVQKIISQNAEKKYHYTNQSPTTISYSGQSFPLSAISQGNDNGERVGNKINLKRLQINLTASAADQFNVMRIVIIQTTDGSSPSWTNFMSEGGSTLSPLSLVIPDQISNIRFIYDSGPFPLTVNDSNMTRNKKINIALYNKKNAMKTINYESSVNTAGPGVLRMYVISDSAAATHPSFSFVARLDYTDQ